ncbi:MAG: LysR family transcriptional regulator [Eubacteriales bacterium]|nr:LysR family transcriptional regulator [Eubacteriales bacterium]
MLRQIRYFQSVVRNNSFSEAAEECHISQSAISQQIKVLENELGFPLLERNSRKFVLTPAGEHFYKKSLVLIADYEQMCSEAAKIARGDEAVLKIGYLRSHNSPEVHQTLEEFSAKYPRVDLQLLYGNHEDLFQLLRTGGADLVLNDQRRAFSDEYVNLILTVNKMYIELAARNPVAELPSVTVGELKNIPCILVASKKQQTTEREFYHTVIGIQSEILYAENLEEARMMVISGRGFLPVEGSGPAMTLGTAIRRVPLYRGEEQISRNYCLFWKKDNSGYYVEEFADILKSKFE